MTKRRRIPRWQTPGIAGAFALAVCSVGNSFAHASAEEVRKLFGHAIDIKKSVVSTESKASLREFSQRLRSTNLASSTDFVEAWPILFTETEPKPAPKPNPYLDGIAGQLDNLEEIYQLYIIRATENRIGDDIRKILGHPDNANGENQLWALKVTAIEYMLLSMIAENRFPDISAVYRDRSEMYSRAIRGEITIEEMIIEEGRNETKKDDLYNVRLEAFKDVLKERPSHDTKPLNAIADKISARVIVQAKYLASDGGNIPQLGTP